MSPSMNVFDDDLVTPDLYSPAFCVYFFLVFLSFFLSFFCSTGIWWPCSLTVICSLVHLMLGKELLCLEGSHTSGT